MYENEPSEIQTHTKQSKCKKAKHTFKIHSCIYIFTGPSMPFLVAHYSTSTVTLAPSYAAESFFEECINELPKSAIDREKRLLIVVTFMSAIAVITTTVSIVMGCLLCRKYTQANSGQIFVFY